MTSFSRSVVLIDEKEICFELRCVKSFAFFFFLHSCLNLPPRTYLVHVAKSRFILF